MNFTRMNLRLLSYVVFLGVAITDPSVFAQYSNEAFEQKKAGELYDERGFLQNKSITVDGKLIVSNSNGNVSYSYPISSWKENGYGFTASLNYCGSVAFTTYGKYVQENMISPYSSWNRFTQNRPAWLLGVNGFAVQAISLATSFHADPSWTWLYEKPTLTSFDDDDMIWTIDGYDVCNRMQDFAAGVYSGPDSPRPVYRDVIRLLRSDGSVLELLNINYEINNVGASNLWSRTEHLYSGYYVVNEANSPGYAYVEYQDMNKYRVPPYLYGIPPYSDDFLPNLPRYLPRVVHYYPGDGLEYVFGERFNPYGMQDLRDPLVQFGGARANPTTFYLSEIRSAGERLVEFHYSRHKLHGSNVISIGPNFRSLFTDSTKGRALLTKFGDNALYYGNGWMSIQADGRTTIIRFDTIAYSGNAEESQEFPLATLGYMSASSEALSRVPLTGDGHYKSWLGYVTRITDPEGRETTFDYEEYERRYVGFGFPRSGGSIKVALKNYRLSKIVEPTAQYKIKYYNRGGGEWADKPLNEVDTDGLDTLTVTQGAVGRYPFAFSNFARKLEKRGLGLYGTLLRTDTYDFFFPDTYSPTPTTPAVCVHSTEDHISGNTTTTTYSYRSDTLPRSIPFTPIKLHTQLRTVNTYGLTDGVKTDSRTTTTYESAIAPYLWLPTSRTSSVNGAAQGSVLYRYRLDTVRRYGDNNSLIKYHGMEIGLKEERTFDRLGRLHVIDSTRYLNVPAYDTTLTSVRSGWKKLEMYRKYDSLQKIKDPDVYGKKFSEVAYDDPRILTTSIDTIINGSYKIPPMFGLLEERWLSDRNGNYLSGTRNYYCLLDDCDDGTGILANSRFSLRGALLSDTIYGRGRATIPGKKIGYEHDRRGRPNLLENALGARVRSHYVYKLPDLPSGQKPEGLILANDNGRYVEELPNYSSYFARRYELPQSQQIEVRRYDPSLRIVTDTLTTLYERTYFGQLSETVDPNGWISRFDYDYNGRLKTVWLPYDFQSLDSIYRFDYSGLESLIGYARTGWTTYHDTIGCDPNSLTTPGRTIDYFGGAPGFFVDKPLKLHPRCAGGYDTVEAAERKGAGTQATVTADIPWTHRSPAKATLSFIMPEAHGNEILSLDSAFVELYITTIIGKCVTLKVTMPDYKTFEKTYVLDCNATRFELPNGGGTQTGTTGEKGSSTQSLRLDTLDGKVRLRIDLSGWLDSIENEDYLLFSFETTTTSSEVHFVNGYECSDRTAPRLQLYGDFRKLNKLSDYTLRYEYDDEKLTSELFAKIDDSAHTANLGVGGIAMSGESRRTSTKHFFGADYRLLKSKTPIGPPESPTRHDSVLVGYDGLGNPITATDQVGDIVRTRYDALGRADTTWNQDGTYSTADYYYCDYAPESATQSDCFGITDQDFYGFIKAKVTTDENRVKFVEYYDVFDRLRREVADSGGRDERTTTYEYDVLGRLTEAKNPAGDVTTYWYDDFGRVRYKQQPDLGTISYAYDKVGNLRFLQSQEQHEEDRITFNEYDDLNRLVIVGEADFSERKSDGHPDHHFHDDPHRDPDHHFHDNPSSNLDPEKSVQPLTIQGVPGDETLNLDRLSDRIDPDFLHDEGNSGILTANMTLWLDPASYGKSIPTFWSTLDTISRDCPEMKTVNPDATGPFLKHTAEAYEPGNEISTFTDFENLARHPENVRIAIGYDRMPDEAGPVWGTFPGKSTWDGLAPKGSVRNLKGREAAVAYREHGGEPFHYSVMSYDERGRPEALLRYTDNLGFDAVYYRYNSMNQVISVTTADPLRQHTTWYGYDDNARVDSVWTQLGDVGTGLGHVNPVYPSTPLNRPLNAQITYVYTPTGQVDSMYYPSIDVVTAYSYSPRKWLDRLKATQGGVDLFEQELRFDPTGQITEQASTHGTNPIRDEIYSHDNLGQLRMWIHTPPGGTQGVTSYHYDSVGNRARLVDQFSGGSLLVSSSIGRTEAGKRIDPNAGPNQLLESQRFSGDALSSYTEYAYDPDGALSRRKHYDAQSVLRREERFSYSSWRGLSWKYKREEKNPLQMWEYRYRYNATGERESKRGGLNLNPSAGDRKGDTTVVRFDLIRVSTDPPIFHGLVNIAGDTTGITLSKDTITFSDTALADLGENIIIAGDGALVTSNSDTTIVNFSGEIFKDSVFFNGFVSIGGDTTGVVFSKDTITFSDTVIIAVDSTVPPDNPVNPVLTTVSGGATLVAINSKSSPTSTPSPDRSWTYYLLGGTKEQLSVWQGIQTSQSGFCGDTGGQSQVYFYPEEYLTYAIEYPGIREDIPRLRLQPDGGIEYRITDHLGSNRVTLDGSGVVTNRYDYKPFGGILSSGGEARQGFNSREKDKESNLFNNGVRKLDDNIGRFTSIDPLWESFPSWSPYQYGYNNPLKVTDPGGMQGRTPVTPQVETGPDGLPSLSGRLYYSVGSLSESGTTILLQRLYEFGDATIGRYELPGTDIAGYMLEPAGPSTKKSGQDLRIPEGEYNLKWHYGSKYQDVPKLYNDQVPEERAILIHKGETGRNTRGCLLPGNYDVKNRPNYLIPESSRGKLDELLYYIKKIGMENMRLIISEPEDSSVPGDPWESGWETRDPWDPVLKPSWEVPY